MDVLSGSSYGKIVTPEIGISDKATLNVRVGENALSSGSIRLTLIDADTFRVGMPAELRIAEVGVMGFDPETYVENFTNIVVGDRYKLTFVEAGVYDLALNKTERENVREKGGNQTEQGVAGALIDVGGFGSDTPMRGVADRINNLSQDPSRQREYFDALGALAPSGSDVTGTNAVSNTAQLFNAISGRFDGSFGRNFALNGVNNRGMSAGEKVVGKSAIWGQMLYNQANLKDRGSVRGFDSDSSGIALGFETNLNDNLKVGTGLSYTSTEVDVINKNNDINTYGWFGYGKYQFAKLFNETYASYGFSRYDETRNVAGSNVYAKYNSESLAVKSLIGTDFDFYGFYVTPKAGLQYMAILSDGFIDSVGQKVGDSSSDIITAVSEVKIEKGFKINETVDVLPNVKLGLSYDIKNDSNNSVVSLANGSSYTSYGMALKRTEFMSGLGAKFEIGDDVEVSVDYIGKFREDFTDNTGMITAKYKF
ncbi:MAG: Outer membrane protein B precursor [Alphaproteobacteria bacterium ADurb.Bin438]|nr:MAG: Outer membrane protein B precursor [Alphaproteobacteria bacterium ADurb.Bin438]